MHSSRVVIGTSRVVVTIVEEHPPSVRGRPVGAIPQTIFYVLHLGKWGRERSLILIPKLAHSHLVEFSVPTKEKIHPLAIDKEINSTKNDETRSSVIDEDHEGCCLLSLMP